MEEAVLPRTLLSRGVDISSGRRRNNPECAENEYNPDQPAFEQAEQEDGQVSPDEQAMGGYLEEDNYMPPPKMR